MFLGHYAVAFSFKSVAPTPSLGTAMMAAQWLDLVWPLLVLAGVEQVRVVPGITAVTPLDFVHYPYSHSLVAALAWALLFGVGFLLRRRSRRDAALLGAVVFSHWLLDFASHRPDMPLAFDGPKVGLGLWYSVPATLAAELLLLGGGLLLYLRGTRAVDRTGRWALAGLALLLVLLYLGSLFGPPPPSGHAVAASALAQWGLVAWGFWIDHHRRAQPFARLSS